MYQGKTIAAIVVARQGSTRLPGKHLLEVDGITVLEFIYRRLRSFELFEEIVLCTTDLPGDDEMVDKAKAIGYTIYRGYPEDVLGRIAGCLESVQSDLVTEVGGDCPFIDKKLLIKGFELFCKGGIQYVTNVLPMTYPDGLDVHIAQKDTIKKINKLAENSSERSHPFSFFFNHKDTYSTENFSSPVNYSGYRLTLDYYEDYQLIAKVVENFSGNYAFSMQEILSFLDNNKDVLELNMKYVSESTIPAYWRNSSYYKDCLNDLASMLEKCFELESLKKYDLVAEQYSKVISLTNQLLQRSIKMKDEN
jgi:spore coat polysaccharide biosynthesis protein SpsF (cytidylyltransferase family)